MFYFVSGHKEYKGKYNIAYIYIILYLYDLYLYHIYIIHIFYLCILFKHVKRHNEQVSMSVSQPQ